MVLFLKNYTSIKSTPAFNQELCDLNSSQAIQGISFHKIGQEKNKRSKGKARKMRIPTKNKTSKQTIEKNLPEIAQCMHIAQGIIKENFFAGTGETFKLNDYTLLVNSTHGGGFPRAPYGP